MTYYLFPDNFRRWEKPDPNGEANNCQNSTEEEAEKIDSDPTPEQILEVLRLHRPDSVREENELAPSAPGRRRE